MEDYRLKENQSVPMDPKRRDERLTYDADKPLSEQSEKVFNIKTGFTTVTETPTYGLVRETQVKWTSGGEENLKGQ